MSTYTGTETLAKAIGGQPSAPTFVEVVDVVWDDKYDPAAPLTLAGKLKGTFVASIPARLLDAAVGYVAIVDDLLTYTGQSASFTVGDTLKGTTSGATALIVDDQDAGATGSLLLKNRQRGPTGLDFISGEALTDDHTGNGTAAVVDPAVRVYGVSTAYLVEIAKDVDLTGIPVRLVVITE